MIADSSKPNMLRNVYAIRSTTRNVTIQKRKVNYFKIKVVAFILEETNPFAIESCKSKNEASVSVLFALFNCSSGGINLFDHAIKKKKKKKKTIVSVQKVIEVPRSHG